MVRYSMLPTKRTESQPGAHGTSAPKPSYGQLCSSALQQTVWYAPPVADRKTRSATGPEVSRRGRAPRNVPPPPRPKDSIPKPPSRRAARDPKGAEP